MRILRYKYHYQVTICYISPWKSKLGFLALRGSLIRLDWFTLFSLDSFSASLTKSILCLLAASGRGRPRSSNFCLFEPIFFHSSSNSGWNSILFGWNEPVLGEGWPGYWWPCTKWWYFASKFKVASAQSLNLIYLVILEILGVSSKQNI